jgi:hypothetical protein
LLLGVDYTNGNFGLGNAFNHRANVTGTGLILANPAVTQTLGGSVADGGTALATMSFGNIHAGDSSTLNYQINNVGGTGPNLRGAIQTSVNGANLTDSRLSGAGVTAGNIGPISAGGNSGNLAVTFNATSAGALTGQLVRVINKFDNVADQLLQFTGAAYRYANPTPHTPEPVEFGILHVGDPAPSQTLSITNDAANDGFSERLNASIGNPTGDATTNGGSFAGLLPTATDSTSLTVGIDTSSAGTKSGTATITFTSDGTGTSGLGTTSLANQTVTIVAQVNNFAVADVLKLAGDGVFGSTGVNQFSLDLGSIVQGQPSLITELGVINEAPAPADSLAGSFTSAASDFSLTGFDPFAGLAAGSTRDNLLIELDSTIAGMFSGQITLQPQSTNPTPFSMDLAPITIDVIGHVGLAGDYNRNNTVDAADYVEWRDSFGATITAYSGADGNGNGTIDGGDFDVWRAHFGQMIGSGAGANLDSWAVPEPDTALLIFVGLTGLQWRIKRRARRFRR